MGLSITIKAENVMYSISNPIKTDPVSLMKEVRVTKGRLTLSNLAPYVNEIFEIKFQMLMNFLFHHLIWMSLQLHQANRQ